MTNFREFIDAKIREIHGDNAEYLLGDCSISQRLEWDERFLARHENDERYEEFFNNSVETTIRECNGIAKNWLTPVTAQVGEGVTVNLWSDRHAGTIIKRTPCSITIQYDTATLDPNFKPKIIPGGFVGHCINQDEQTYTYERNPNGRIEVYRWSKKDKIYKNGSITISRGRHEFYDYNF